jgi:hypothetical protein
MPANEIRIEEDYIKLWSDKLSGKLNSTYDELLTKDVLNLQLQFAFLSQSYPHAVVLRPDKCITALYKGFWKGLGYKNSEKIKNRID